MKRILFLFLFILSFEVHAQMGGVTFVASTNALAAAPVYTTATNRSVIVGGTSLTPGNSGTWFLVYDNGAETLTDTDNQIRSSFDGDFYWVRPIPTSGSAPANTIVGPGSPVTDEAVVRWNGTTTNIQNSAVIISDTGEISGVNSLTATNSALFGSVATITNVTSASVVGTNSVSGGSVTATTTLTIPQSDDPDISAAGQLSWDTDGWLRAYDGSAQVAVGRKIEEIHATIIAPNDLADAVRDACLIWSNESGMSFIVTGWKAWSGTDDTDLNIEETDSDGQSNATVDAVTIATNGTGLYYGSDTTITAATIENGHLLWLDFDDADTPTYVKVTIYGYYDANVN